MKKFDPRLYLIADPHFARASRGKPAFLSIVEKAIHGGVTLVQLRYKNYESGIMNYGRQLRQMTKKAGIPLIINDYVDLALTLDADGVHLGQEDMPMISARKILARKRIIGVSAKTVAQAKRAQRDGADYLGVGPIFLTKSKADAGDPIGLETLASITRSVRIPVVGIGGITLENVEDVMKAGASGVAVISAIMGAGDPEKEAREFLYRIKKYES